MVTARRARGRTKAKAAPRALFLGVTFAGHATRFGTLREMVSGDGRLESTFGEVNGWKAGGLIERLALGSERARGKLRATLEAAAFARVPPPDVTWTSAGELILPYLWLQLGPLRRPLVLEMDWTLEQREAMAPHYYGRPPREGRALALARARERWLWRQATAFVPWSNWAAAPLRAAGIREERIHVIPPGVDLERWQPVERRPAAEERPLRLLFVGGDFRRKGGELLVEMVASERFRDRFVLDIVTREAVAERPGVRVHRAEANTAALRERYAEADLFVMPSLADCFGIATVEAMATGLPVLVSDVGGAADIVEEGRSGWLIEPRRRR